MAKLSKALFEKVEKALEIYGRPLERSLFEMRFKGGSKEAVLDEVKRFQNEDGGFGNGIESDFRLPYSSPMATSVGIRVLTEIDELEEAQALIKLAIHYLEQSYNHERQGWFALSKDVNDFPHAPWWHFDEAAGMTVIDKNWGNPSAEILAYLYRYRMYVTELDVDALVEHAVKAIEEKTLFESENELYCYIQLYEVLPETWRNRLEKALITAVPQVIELDEHKWGDYVPRPIDFVESPDGCRFGIEDFKIEDNLDFIIMQLEQNEKILPPWGKRFYQGDLKPAYNEWIGVWNLKALTILESYGRIEK